MGSGATAIRTRAPSRWAKAACIAALALLSGWAPQGCVGKARPRPAKVDLGRTVPLPGVRFVIDSVGGTGGGDPFHIAITGMLGPRETRAGYAPFLAYLEAGLGRPVELVQRRSYAELNALIEVGRVDAGLICPLPYVQGQRSFGMELLGVSEPRSARHETVLIVPRGSKARGLEGLRDRTFAFSDPDSCSGWLTPAYQLATRGETPSRFFKRFVFTYHHTESIRAVADELVDGAAVDATVYEYTRRLEPERVERTLVVSRWGEAMRMPFVARSHLPDGVKRDLRRILFGMASTPDGARILADLGFRSFGAADDAVYDMVRRMEAEVRRVAGGKEPRP